jgi:hypothetical protein
MEQQDLELASQAITPDPEIDQVVCDCLYKLLPTLKADYAISETTERSKLALQD